MIFLSEVLSHKLENSCTTLGEKEKRQTHDRCLNKNEWEVQRSGLDVTQKLNCTDPIFRFFWSQIWGGWWWRGRHNLWAPHDSVAPKGPPVPPRVSPVGLRTPREPGRASAPSRPRSTAGAAARKELNLRAPTRWGGVAKTKQQKHHSAFLGSPQLPASD